MINELPRLRFAPSPTGYLHVGGLRTALYNYLFAKRNRGTFVLRIEDTDRNRFVPGAVENLIDSLHWAGLDYDEGPYKEGAYGPYVQSERLAIYKHHTDKLLANRNAYYCFCTAERLTQLRNEQASRNEQKKYDKRCLSLTKEEVQIKLSEGAPYVIRMDIKPNELIEVDDIIRGHIQFDSSTIDDQVLMKSDGYPTYHLANVVDDHLMKITHVIRGEEWLPSIPKHKLLYDYFGWEVPTFAHLPLLLNPDRSKLSKRQGDVAVEDYRKNGYLKEALVNFVALLGWTAGDDKEFYYMNELIDAFSLERVNKSGAVFDLQKLKWLNAEHLRTKDIDEVALLLRTSLQDSPFDDFQISDEKLKLIIEAMKERVEFIPDIWKNAPYLFTAPSAYEEATVQKRWKENSGGLLEKLAAKFQLITEPIKEHFENALHKVAEENGVKNADLIHPLRIAISGVGGGPGVFDIVVIIGKDETIQRINTAIDLIRKK